jgi:hypothetical protein
MSLLIQLSRLQLCASSACACDKQAGCLGLPSRVRGRQVRDALAVGAGKTVLGYLKGEAGVWDAIVRAYKSKGDPLNMASREY